MELRNIDLEIVKKIWNTVNIKDNECLIINDRYFNNPWELQRYRFF